MYVYALWDEIMTLKRSEAGRWSFACVLIVSVVFYLVDGKVRSFGEEFYVKLNKETLNLCFVKAVLKNNSTAKSPVETHRIKIQ